MTRWAPPPRTDGRKKAMGPGPDPVTSARGSGSARWTRTPGLERGGLGDPLGGAAIEHGSHLPYDTDLIIAVALVEAVAEQIEATAAQELGK